MKRLYLLCALLVAGLLALTRYYRSEPDTFYGIADAKEIVISCENPVEITRLQVVPGELVAQGDTLLVVHSAELELRLSQISHELTELRTRKSAHATLSKSELLQLKAQQEERVSEIRAEIAELEAQYDLNKRLVSELRSLDREKATLVGTSDAQNPILAKLESLRRMLALVQDPTRIYENRLASALSNDGDPISDQVSRLEDELRILEEERKRQVILAQISGVIGSINFKVGEKVSPFDSILTLHSGSPSFVRAYIHEDVYSQVAVRQRVKVHGIQNHSEPVEGVVMGVGARIVEYPERLRKRPDILIWGREVVVKLPPKNRFLLGEKVVISLPKSDSKSYSPPAPLPPETTGSMEQARSAPEVATAPAVAGLAPPGASSSASTSGKSSPGSLGKPIDLPGLEASGLLWLEDIGKLLLISDDTKKKEPLVFLADSALKTVKPALIKGLDKMDDMEAVSAGANGSLYVLSSQSQNKKGKLSDARKLLIKAGRKGGDFSLQGKVLLHDVLAKAAAAEPGAPWAAFLSKGITGGTLDFEGMAVRGDSLYLGVKAPLLDGKAVILLLSGLDSLFRGAVPGGDRISLWKTLDLRGGTPSTPCGIADLLFVGGDAWLISTGTAGAADPNVEDGAQGKAHVGGLWRLAAGADKASLSRDFGGEKPEGLAWHAGSRSFFVAFDNGSKQPSRILRVEAPR